MARNVGNWLRWWVGTVSDPKLAAVALLSKQSRANVVAVWSCVLERGWCADDRGRPSELPSDEFAACLDIPIESVEAVLEAMRAKRMLDGTSITNWDKRNPDREDETSADRVRRHRLKRNETQCNADVTHCNAVKRNETQCNAPETEADIDADTEAELKEEEEEEGEPAQAPSPPPAKKTSARKGVDDEEWLKSLEKSEAYRGIDVRALLSKMIIWCENKGQMPTRQRLLNWLNREPKPIESKTPAGREAAFDKLVEDMNANRAKQVS